MKDLNLKTEFEQMLSLFENENKDEILSYIKERLEFFLLFDLDNPYKTIEASSACKEKLHSDRNLQEQIIKLQNSEKELQKEITELKEDILYHRESIKKINKENETLTKKLEKQGAGKEENDLLKKQVESLKEKIKDIDARYERAVNMREKEISDIIDRLKKEHARMNSVNSAEIAALQRENKKLKSELSAKSGNDELLKRCELIANDPFKETNESLINNRIQEIKNAYKAITTNMQRDIDNYIIKLREAESKLQKTESNCDDELLNALKVITKNIEKYKAQSAEWKTRYERALKQMGANGYLVDGKYYSLPTGKI